MMIQVWSNMSLHLHAADGYKNRSNRQVGWHGGPFDCERSRRVFRRLNVRDKLATEIAMVRHEARAGRLKWTYDDVKSLIQP